MNEQRFMAEYVIPTYVGSGTKGKRRDKFREKIRESLPIRFQQGVNYGNRFFHLDITLYRVDGSLTPDIDNTLKNVLDAIKWRIIPDDKMVRSLTAKIENNQPEAAIKIRVSEYYEATKPQRG